MSDYLPINSDWQSCGNTSDSLWYMLEKQLMCDVVFEVGKEYERIGAHTIVLAARSHVFFKMFSQAPPQKEITLEDVKPKHFRLFLRYLYTGVVTVDQSDNEGILDIADKYKVTRLTEMAIAETLSTMSAEQFCAFVSKYSGFSAEIQARCLRYALENTRGLFNCAKFVELPFNFLRDLLENEYLELEEEAICTAVLLWATKSCENNNMEVNGENQRKVLKEVLHLVRFPLLSQDFFTENISEKELLTPTEEVQLLKFFLNSKSTLKPNFNMSKRKAPEEPFSLDSHKPSTPSLSFYSVDGSLPITSTEQNGASNIVKPGTSKDVLARKQSSSTLTQKPVELSRFTKQGQGWGYNGNKRDAVAFTSSKDIRLESVFVYGSSKESSKMDIMVTIRDDHNVIYVKETEVESTKSQPTYEIVLSCTPSWSTPTIKANTTYHIIILLRSETGFYGKAGNSSIKKENVTFNFRRSKYSTNNSTENIGQIPGFKFTIL